MTSTTPFKKSVVLWKKREREFGDFLERKYWDDLLKIEYAPDRTFKDRDVRATLMIDGEKCIRTYEVKSDTKSLSTGNFVIEFTSYGKKSWIAATKADYRVHYTLPHWRWIQDVAELKTKLKEKRRFVVRWWNRWASQMFKMPCSELPYLFNKIKPLMDKQDLAIISALTDFVKETDRADYALGDKEEILNKYFNLINDEWDDITYIQVKTTEWEFSHWYTFDVAPWDIENLFAWIRSYTKMVLFHQYDVDV